MRSPAPSFALFVSKLTVWLGLFAAGGTTLANPTEADSERAKFFHDKIVPLLNEKCLSCHSHAARQMEGGLTLDSRSGWETGGDRGSAVIPSQLDQSLLIQAVRYQDEDLQMPPDEKLADEEVALLENWVRQGAYDDRSAVESKGLDTDWWSLKPLTQVGVPAEGNPIDAFVHDTLRKAGLEPVAPADRETLIRRLYVDLHGYLPLPDEVQGFVDDREPGAYERLVDRLLESPRYGERWARHWLDVVHFADSHGCEHDVKRPHAWRYRDYVIDRLNADVSWPDFIREQLAPEVFFPEQPQLMAGLGFVAAGPLELSRAGTAPVTFDYLDRDDMVTQTMAAFVSTTANCARCHTHKFDPITQEDYYSLQAVFAGIGKGDIEFDSSTEIWNRRQELQSLVAACDSKDPSILEDPKYASLISAWVEKRKASPPTWVTLDPEIYVSSGGATLTKQDDGSVLASGIIPDQDHYTVAASVMLNRVTAIRVEVLPDESLPMNGPGRAGNGNLHLTEVAVHWFGGDSKIAQELRVSRTSADFDQAGWTSAQSVDGDQQSGWAIFPNINQGHEIVFELAQPVDVTARGGRLSLTLKQLYPPKHLIGRFRVSVTDSDQGVAQILPQEVRTALLVPSDQWNPTQRLSVAAHVLREHALGERERLPAKAVVYGVSSSWSHAKKLPSPQAPKTVHVLRRGAFDQPQSEVGPGALSALKQLTARFEIPESGQESLRRAALADWLAHRDNPLTWRSAVNRVWHFHFGRGLCDTPNDFGRMGSQPSHPELLDWLAIWFRDQAGGSLKELHRLILTSQVYRRSSLGEPREADSDNRLLWRMDRRRLDAEAFRDSVLRMCGRLDVTMGGPGVEQFVKSKGPQATPALDYEAYDWNSVDAHRRSIYRVVWRGIPDPFMEALDFPDLGLLAPERAFSVSSLQSLAVFNNQFVLHASEWMAERLDQEHDELSDQVSAAVRSVWLRSASTNEQQRFCAFADQHGLAAFCRVLLNSNEFLFVD